MAPGMTDGTGLAWLFLAGLATLVSSGLMALLSGGDAARATRWGMRGAVAGCALAFAPAVLALFGDNPVAFRAPWHVPLASFSLGIDRISAFFLVPILLVSALGAIYGSEYLKAHAARHSLGPPWAFYNALVAAMLLVVTARNGMLFLFAWEMMALASFFLVTFEDERPEVRDAGWIYLVATHLGTACLLPFFLVLGHRAGSLDFERLGAVAALPPAMAAALFALAVVGFGAKAGFMPLHVWLPEAHPAAPSHVSAVMSGVMIKTGIYGLVRFLPMLGEPQAWWGWVFIAIGLSSGILGVVFALAQQDVKRLLAYSSVENIGIIALGLGVGMVGQAAHSPIAYLGYAGALLHVLNHAFFKGLLFMAAGTVAHAAHTRSLDRLGGLQKTMPWTGVAFFTGTVAICGLPPLNGFASEFLIYLGALRDLTGGAGSIAAASTGTAGTGAHATPLVLLLVVAGLALIGGLAAATFAKAYGAVFLGLPRSAAADGARDPGPAMRWPPAILAALCGTVGLAAPWILAGLEPVVRDAVLVEIAVPAGAGGLAGEVAAAETAAVAETAGVAGTARAAEPPPGVDAVFSSALQTLLAVTAVSAAFLVLTALLWSWRKRLLSDRPAPARPTWDCGYAAPTARMQYTASSLSQPLTRLFGVALRTRRLAPTLRWPFPDTSAYHSETPDVFRQRLFAPVYALARSGAAKLRWIQHGNLQLYVLYIAVTVVVLLVWKLG